MQQAKEREMASPKSLEWVDELQLCGSFIDQSLLFDILQQRAEHPMELSALSNLVKFLL